MRVTESSIMRAASRAMGRGRAQLSESQREITTGTRVDRPSQDVSAWARSSRAKVRTMISEGRGQAIRAARERLDEAALTFDGLGSIVRRARELATAAANDTLDAADRNNMAREIQLLSEQANDLANRRGTDGQYLLSGTDTRPSFDNGGNYQGNGVINTIEIGEGLRRAAGVSGTLLTAAEGIDVLVGLDDLRAALEANDTVAIQASLGDMVVASEQVALAYAQVGTQMQALDLADDSREELELTLVELTARAVDADPIEAASTMARSTTALQTAQAMAQQIASLFQL